MKTQLKTEKINFWFFRHHLSFRVTPFLREYADKLNNAGINYSDYFVDVLIEHFNKYIDKTDKESKEWLDNLNEYYALKKERQLQKEQDHNRYLIRNTQRKLYNMESASLYNSGKLNMKIANALIDGALRIYKLIPKDIQEELKEDMIELERFRNEDILGEKVSVLKFLMDKSKNGKK